MKRRRHIGRAAGFTLIEVMLVIGIVGLVSVSMVMGFRALVKSELRGSATKLAGAIRYLFDRASTTGKMHRLVIDFESGRYWAEVSDDRFYMPREKETEESRQRADEERAAEEEAEKEAKERGESIESTEESSGYNAAQYEPEEFRPKRAQFNAFKETALRTVEVRGGAKLAGVFTPRLTEPATTGRSYVYFYPLGMTEAALVYVSDKNGETFYTLVVHPLTGRVRVHNQYIQPPVSEQYDDSGQRIDRE